MANKCFLSFHYKQDSWRVSQVRQIGAIENSLYWIRTNGKKSRKQAMMPSKWIADNMKGKECLVVLVGEKTASRRWVKHEIKKAGRTGWVYSPSMSTI